MLRRKWRTWRHFSARERALICQAWFSFFGVRVWLGLCGFNKTRQHLSTPLCPNKTIDPVHLCDLIKIAAHYSPVRPNCLCRSLVGWKLLAENGIQADLVFGIRKDQQKLEAHAWLEMNGQVLNDSPNIIRNYERLLTNT
jgi:hypothetical protein